MITDRVPIRKRMEVRMPNATLTVPHFFDSPPHFYEGLVRYGVRPYWSPDGSRIAFVEKAYGDICEVDLATRQVRNLTRDNGDHHSFLRVLFLPGGEYLLIGPAVFKDRETSRHRESELWLMDARAERPPRPLGQRINEGAGVSTLANRITYAVNGHHDPRLAVHEYEIRVSEIEDGPEGPRLAGTRGVLKGTPGVRLEPQDFRHNDTEIVFAEYHNMRVGYREPGNWKCITRGLNLKDRELTTFIDEPLTHNECEGIFPDHEHVCLESSCDYEDYFPPIDLWKLKLDGTGRRVRMTRAIDRAPWRTSNSNVSPDGRWLAFMINRRSDESGTGGGIGLLDLAAWEKSPEGQAWELPHERRRLPHIPHGQ
jgi:hypothetical protein